MTATRIIDSHTELADIGSSDHHVRYADAEAVAAANADATGCCYQKSSAQVIISATWTKVEFNNNVWDIDNDYDDSLFRFVASKAGYYQINTNVAIVDLNTDKKFIIAIRKNDVGIAAGRTSGNTPNYATGIFAGTTQRLEINDYIEVFAFHDSTGDTPTSKNLATGSYTTFSIIKIAHI